VSLLFLMLLFLLQCPFTQAAEPVSRYENAALPAHKLWLSIDTANSSATGDSQWLREQIELFQAALSNPWQAERPLPAEGVALGAIAVTQLNAPAELLHPSVGLDERVQWPSQHLSRTLHLLRNLQAAPSDADVWPIAQPHRLALQWPHPEPPIAIDTLTLALPLHHVPSQWPAFWLEFADGASFALATPEYYNTTNGPMARFSLQGALQGWQQNGHSGEWPRQPWMLRWQAQTMSQQGAWAAWQSTAPAVVSITWEELSAFRTGREQLLRRLKSLLPSEGVQLPANVQLLTEKTQMLLEAREGCERSSRLLLSPHHPVSSDALARWRDQSLALPAVVVRQQLRLASTEFIGVDRHWEQAVPGRRAWLGGPQMSLCNAIEDCESLPPLPALSAALATSLWLSDTNPHQALVALTDVWSSFKALHADWQQMAEPPPVSPLRGSSLYVDAGASAAMPTGRAGLLLWLSSDGSVQAQEANTGSWLWAWRPRESAVRWAELMRNDSLSIHTAEARYATSKHQWALWPPLTLSTREDGLDAIGQRWLYGLVDQQWVVLNLAQPSQPKSGFLPLLNGASPLLAAQQQGWGSLSLLPLILSNGQQHPLILLSAASTHAASQIMLVDGRNGRVLWQANKDQDASLSHPWRAAWQSLPTQDGSLLAYGVDEAGRVWRLRIAPNPSDVTALQVSLNRIADFSETGVLFTHAPSLTWLRDRRGLRVPALALTAVATIDEMARRPAAVFTFQDTLTLDAASASASVITNANLVQWSSGNQPPAHSVGWLRELSTSEQIAQPARWLAEQVVLASEQPAASNSRCPEWAWRAKLYRWPWRNEKNGVLTQAASAELPISSLPVGNPYLSEMGALGWLGVPADDNATNSVSVPVGYRQRVKQRQLRADD
jgi:hypothetical protein